MAEGGVEVQQLFNNFLRCDRPHESNVSIVGAPREVTPTATPVLRHAPVKASESSSENSASGDKKQRRREQNRRAAVKSRKRKKFYMGELETKVGELKTRNEELVARLKALEEENEKLKLHQSKLVRSESAKDVWSPVVRVRKEPSSPEVSHTPEHVTTVVKSESAALTSQQRMTTQTICQFLISLLLAVCLAFGQSKKCSRVKNSFKAQQTSGLRSRQLSPFQRACGLIIPLKSTTFSRCSDSRDLDPLMPLTTPSWLIYSGFIT